MQIVINNLPLHDDCSGVENLEAGQSAARYPLATGFVIVGAAFVAGLAAGLLIACAFFQ